MVFELLVSCNVFVCRLNGDAWSFMYLGVRLHCEVMMLVDYVIVQY